METAGLFRQIGIEVAHESCELVGISRCDQKVKVVREASESVDLEWMTLLSSSEQANEDLAPSRRRLEEVPALESAHSHLDQAVLRDESQRSTHAV